MVLNKRSILAATYKAKEIQYKHNSAISNPLLFRSDLFLMSIVASENIYIESYSFQNDLCGLLIIDEDETTLVFNSHHSPERRNFTIGHELGHYFLHKNDKTRFEDRSKNMTDFNKSVIEMQANAFASHLILPTSVLVTMLNSHYHFYRISKIVKISYQALYWRIFNYLTDVYSLNWEDAKEIVDDYVDMSAGSIKNLIHHKHAMIYRLTPSNHLELMGRIRAQKTFIRFVKDATGDIIEVMYGGQAFNYQGRG